MNRRFPIGLAIAIFLVVGILAALRFAPPVDWNAFKGAERVGSAPSDIYASLLLTYDNPPMVSERYQMEDRNGASTFEYTVSRYEGPRKIVTTTIKVPSEATYQVSFFFGQLVSDGAWDVNTQPDRGNATIHYTLTMRQTEDFKSGEHVVRFTDPHYWATTAGHEFHIHLSPTGPLPNLLTLKGAGLRDPRYSKIVDDFRNFGPAAFRAAIASARAQAHT